MFVSFIMEKSNNKNINNIPFIIQEYLLFSVHICSCNGRTFGRCMYWYKY